MGIVTEFPREVAVVEDMGIPMPDGIRLSARVWLPEDAAIDPVPAVLEMIPYRKRDGTVARDEMMHPYVAGHGYACVRVDMRGNGESEGLMDDEYSRQEMDDICAVIGWLAAQPWCSGRVGMMGKSWGGFNCLQAAFNQPPALKAVIAVCATADRFADDIHFKGGCLLGENFGWGAVMLSYSSRPADPVLREGWRADWLARLEAEPWLAPRWAAHQARDGYWKHGSVCEDYARMQVPVMIWSGWADNYMNTTENLLRGVPAPCKAVVGPWVHQYPHTAVPGPQVGFLQMAVRWWDRWLKDIPNGAEDDPALRAFVMDSAPPDASAATRAGAWVAEAAWPSARVTERRLFLRLAEAGGVTPPASPVGYLDEEEAGDFTVTVATPQHLGLQAGEFFPMGLNAEMPGDQAEDDALSVCFDGTVLDAPLTLLGQARLSLRLSSDAPLGFVVARLCDVAPDGSSVRIAHGMLNLCHRDSMEHPSPMVAGQAVGVTVTLDMAGYRVAAGHRLRVALSNSYWPFVWPSPAAGRLEVTAGELVLPVHDGTAPDWQPPPPEHAVPWRHSVLRPARAARRIERDLIGGTVALVVETDEGAVRDDAHGLLIDERMTERWEIRPDDPLSARATHVWEQRRARDGWDIRTRAEAEMTATATHLRMRARLVAWEGEEEVFRRDWDEEVERRFL